MPEPNILIIKSDQHNACCLGVNGHKQVKTPNLDGLARDGVNFTKAFVQSPICTPSRMSYLTGEYVHNHGQFGLEEPPSWRRSAAPRAARSSMSWARSSAALESSSPDKRAWAIPARRERLRIRALMARLRSAPPGAIGGRRVRALRDVLTGVRREGTQTTQLACPPATS